MRRQEYFPNEIKPQKKDLKEGERSNLPDKEFQVMVIKMLTRVRRMVEHRLKQRNYKEVPNTSCRAEEYSI